MLKVIVFEQIGKNFFILVQVFEAKYECVFSALSMPLHCFVNTLVVFVFLTKAEVQGVDLYSAKEVGFNLTDRNPGMETYTNGILRRSLLSVAPPRQFHSNVKYSYQRLVQLHLNWNHCLQPEVFHNQQENARVVNITGSCGSIYLSRQSSFVEKTWNLQMPPQIGVNITILELNIHYSGPFCIINSFAIYKSNGSLFGKFCGHLPRLDVFLQESHVKLYLDCTTLRWDVKIIILHQVNNALNTLSSDFFKTRIHPDDSFSHINVHSRWDSARKELQDMMFVSSKEITYLRMQIRFQQGRSRGCFQVQLTSRGLNFGQNLTGRIWPGPLTLPTLVNIPIEACTPYENCKYTSYLPVFSVLLIVRNTEMLKLDVIIGFDSTSWCEFSHGLKPCPEIGNERVIMNTSLRMPLLLGWNSNQSCISEIIVEPLYRKGVETFIHLEIQNDQTEGFVFSECAFGSFTIISAKFFTERTRW